MNKEDSEREIQRKAREREKEERGKRVEEEEGGGESGRKGAGVQGGRLKRSQSTEQESRAVLCSLAGCYFRKTFPL